MWRGYLQVESRGARLQGGRTLAANPRKNINQVAYFVVRTGLERRENRPGG
jgi:hypothetical protein